MKPKVPESSEAKVTRLLEQIPPIASGALAYVENVDAALPSAEALARTMAARLKDAGAKAWESEALARRTATAGRASLLDLARGRRLDELSEGAVAQIEAVVSVTGRPAFVLRHQRPDMSALRREDEFWVALLNPVRERVKAACGKVGCLFRVRDGARQPVGTCWLIGPRLLVTNAHVARLLYRRKAVVPPGDPYDGWRPAPGCDGVVAFGYERGEPYPPFIPLGPAAFVEEDPDARADLAILHLGAVPASTTLPFPIESERQLGSEADWRSRSVLAIGHPIKDLADDPNVEVVFGSLDGTMRLSPGKLLGKLAPGILGHDCSTTNGSSGSPILDLASFNAVGLHYWGKPGQRNEAVLLPAIMDHPAIVKALNGGLVA